MGRVGVKNCPKLRDVIYGRPLSKLKQSKFKILINFLDRSKKLSLFVITFVVSHFISDKRSVNTIRLKNCPKVGPEDKVTTIIKKR